MSPACFERLMEKVSGDLIGKTVWVYIDNILVATESEEGHYKALEDVFVRLRRFRLKLKPSKCRLFQRQPSFLGHIVSATGIPTDPAKIEKLKNCSIPRNPKEIRTFLSVIGCYRKFVPNFAQLAAPLRELTKTGAKFVWSDSCQKSFFILRKRLTEAPILAQPNIPAAVSGERPFIIHTDASAIGIGAVLSLEGLDGKMHPLCYASRTCSRAES